MNLQKSQSKAGRPRAEKIKTPADKQILKRLNEIIKSTTEKIENYQLGEAVRELYDFVWHEYADKYIEASKRQGENVNVFVFKTILKLLHPFMPFITEYIWQMNYKDKNPLIISEWPKPKK